MKILLHICCAPCATYSVRHFQQQGYLVEGFFYNPNIHPYREFKRRLETLQNYCAAEKVPLLVREDYELEKYFSSVLACPPERCRLCCRLRLDEVARTAAERGYALFSTTLSISPYQNHEVLRQEGEAAASRYGLSFVYADLRSGYGESIDISRRLNLYRQPYCGCVFSERERFYKGGT